MRRLNVFLMLLFVCSSVWAQPPATYSRYFTDKTMRVDYFHTGTAKDEYFSLDQAYEEALWPGSKINLLDTLNLGEYLLKVFDLKSNQLIFSRGYATVFGEWQTTEEALNGTFRTFHETLRFPFPKRPVQVVVAARNQKNIFIDKFSTVVEPDSRFVNREQKKSPFAIKPFLKNGEPGKKVDLLIIGDGYTQEELAKFRSDVNRYTQTLFKNQPFKERKSDFNVWMIEAISQESGIDDPRENKWRQTALDASYNAFDSQRYVLTFSNKEVRNLSAIAPYDYIYILVNTKRYGGGIFNSFATCYTGSQNSDPDWWSDYVFVHEFGHLFAGLADEYYTSDVSYLEFYPKNVEPWEPNITRLLDVKHPKWAEWIKPDTQIPTSWSKAEYDSLNAVLRKLSQNDPKDKEKSEQIRKQVQKLLSLRANLVGCFEGAGYASKGIYRPAIDCKMFSKTVGPFCPVCEKAIERMIDFHTH